MGIEVYNFGNNLFNKMKQITVLSLILFLCYSGQNFAQEYIEVEYERITYSKNNSSRSTYFKLYASKDLSVSRLESIGKRERSEEHTSELQSRGHLVCRLLLDKKNVTGIKRLVLYGIPSRA